MSDPVSPVKDEGAGPLVTASAGVRGREVERAGEAVSRYLLGLWRAGIVDRYASPEDGRQRVYRLTEVGAALVQAGVLLEG